MKKYQLKLESLILDLSHRYGPNDPVVKALEEKFELLKLKIYSTEMGERRTTLLDGHIWHRSNWDESRLSNSATKRSSSS